MMSQVVQGKSLKQTKIVTLRQVIKTDSLHKNIPDWMGETVSTEQSNYKHYKQISTSGVVTFHGL